MEYLPYLSEKPSGHGGCGSETFLRLLREGTQFESDEHGKAWLIYTAKNVCRDELRRHRRLDLPLDEARNASSEGIYIDDKVYNYEGQEIGEFDYDSIGFFREGLAPVSHGEKWGFVNRDYQVVIPLEYDQVSIVSEGLIAVKKDDAWSYIDKQGQLVLSLRDMEGSAFRNGIAPVKNDEYKMGAINRSGQLVIPVEYDSVIVLDQYVRVKKDKLYGYLDTEGHEIIPGIYSVAPVDK